MFNWLNKPRPVPPAKKKTQLTGEIAAMASDLYQPLAGFMGTQPNRDPLLASQQPGEGYLYPFGLFEEALDKDAHLNALIAQRKAAVLSWTASVVAADDSPAALAGKDLVDRAIASISGQTRSATGGFERDLAELMDAIPWLCCQRGDLAAVDCSPGRPFDSDASLGWVAAGSAQVAPSAAVLFDTAGNLRLLTQSEPVEGIALPERKFLVFAPYGRHECPYGLPALRSVWWLAWFKRQVLKFWVMYAERYGTPVTVLKHPLAATDKEKQAYRRIIGSLQQETGLLCRRAVRAFESRSGGAAADLRRLLSSAPRDKGDRRPDADHRARRSWRAQPGLVQHPMVREDIVRQTPTR
jgi:hypothetical protein